MRSAGEEVSNLPYIHSLLCDMVRITRLDRNITGGLLPLASIITTYILPLGVLYGLFRLLKYLFIKNWDTVLLKAAKDGELGLLNEAILKKGNINAKQYDTELSPLMLAAINNQNAILSTLISAGADVNARDVEGRVALMYAAKMGFVDIVQILLAKGSDANARGYDGTTALILAASE